MEDFDSMEGILVQDSNAMAGSIAVGDGAALSQPGTPIRRPQSVDELLSSSLSVTLTLPSSLTYLKVEDSREEMTSVEAPSTKATIVASSVQPSVPRRPRGIDVCADPGMVAAMRVPDTAPGNLAATSFRRSSLRVRNSAALKAPKASAAARRKSKPVKLLTNIKKEEAEQELESPGVSRDVEMFSSNAGNGVQQTPLTSDKDVMAAHKSTLKRKHGEEGQGLEEFATLDSACIVSATEVEPERVRSKSVPVGYIDEPRASETGDVESDSTLSSIDTEFALSSGDESYKEGEEQEEGFALDENISKKQKLSNNKALAVSGTKALGASGEPDARDPRVHKDAFQLVQGVLSIPHGCYSCLKLNVFCDRNQPCSRCQLAGCDCSRKPGWTPANPKQQPTERSATLPPLPEASPSRRLENPSLQDTLATRGRPRKSDVKIKREIKQAKKEKPPLLSSMDLQKDKPPGIRKPEVWCETRQELCESLPYYRSYQAGCYGHNGLVYGYLLDGFASPRDYINSKVVISHSGGKSGTDENGQRRLLADQTVDDNTIKYLIKNMNQKWPLILIMGNQCTNSPSKIPQRYCVMDWFKVTAAWAEKDPLSQCTRWKFRFEKLNTDVDGWWAATASEEPNTPEEMVKASCLSCGKESPHIYEQGWACLNPDCRSFWMLNGAEMPTELRYTDSFLSCRTLWPEDFLEPPNSLAPPLDTELSVHVESGGVSRPFWKGMCCPQCGRLSCRELWAGWRCPTCGFSHNPPRVVFDAARLADPHRPVYTGPAIPSNTHHEEISSTRMVRDGLTIIQYQLGDCGTVTHILANKLSNSRPEDANWLLENYQNLDMPFRRFPMKCHHSQGRLLTQQFMYNCGAPYKFIVDVNSVPFDDSPPVVLKALQLIHQRVHLIHPEAEFNEVLNVGYFEKQKMDYHDDGEEGLGETVASISLGGAARMKFRLKSKYRDIRHCWTTEPEDPHRVARFGNSTYNDEAPEDEDEENSGEIVAGPQTNASTMRAKGRSNKAMLDLCLNHGDVMVMKGAEIQTHWEHTVVPTGLFRIAATARYIGHASGKV
ncbi:hypothetical protein L873DRAFT_940586 [Choiromyces venosus 120613-1]|uniref:Alpha-ketoglutarate-dependent dioxygenase AlkB-like domain-containing protein n=1 Tax=Choiromyces venosus 120613-1 TaxID=1336337 RepID=A0A3N4KGR9_9PEZI|nr:hypothetical protein L873DRAFT_940586 [Choiromyces venosus 120613-1]